MQEKPVTSANNISRGMRCIEVAYVLSRTHDNKYMIICPLVKKDIVAGTKRQALVRYGNALKAVTNQDILEFFGNF